MPASSQAPRGPFALLAGLRRELSVPLYRNAYALMANTVGNAMLGLLYWVLAARTFPDAAVGRGNALIALGALGSARQSLLRALELEPANLAAEAALANIAMHLG